MYQDQFNRRVTDLLARILADCGVEKQTPAMEKTMAEIVALQRNLPVKSHDGEY